METETKAKTIRFSIVIPAYNEAHYIADTIDSLKRQHYNGKFEIIVVDNNCSDQTATIARSLGGKVVEEPNPGVCWARQRGTEAAVGEIVVSTDADTTFAPDWLTKIDKAFNANKNAVAVGGRCRYMGGPIWGSLYAHSLFGLTYIVYKLTGKTYYASATNIAFKKSAWVGYDTSLTQGGDELDLLRNLRKCGRVIFAYNNPTFTSARRMARGFIYNLVVTILFYYILEYNLSRIFKRSIIGSAPSFRNELSPKTLQFVQMAVSILAVSLIALYTAPGHYVVRRSEKFINDTDRVTKRVVNEVRSK